MKQESLKRYTSLAAALYLLQNRAITLLDPSNWDDRNDRHFMERYKEAQSLKSLLALCFTEESETYHHWKVFSSGLEGVCIEFDKEKLLGALGMVSGVTWGEVEYLQIKEAIKAPPNIGRLPFTKRYPYKPEKEFRVVLESSNYSLPAKDVPIPLAAINRITLSPWLPKALRGSVVETIRSIKGCSKLKVYRTTLLENDQWKGVMEKVGT